MIALGLANLGSGVLGGLACGGSLSQSAVNDGAGARSEVSPLIASLLSLVTVIALLLLVYRASRPRISMLGVDPGVPGAFADIRRHPGVAPVPGVLIVRPDAPLFYANAELVRDAIEQAAEGTRVVVIVLDGNDDIDITSTEQLGKLTDYLSARNVALGLAHVHGPALEMARRSGLLAKVGPGHIFPTTPAAVAWARVTALPRRPAAGPRPPG
jgi:MFS superfamily sulfate permease-like transporter